MDRNTILGLLLIFLLLIGYSYWASPSKEEQLAKKRVQDSLYHIQQIKDSILLTQKKAEAPISVSTPVIDSSKIQQLSKEAFGVFAGSYKNENRFYTIENDVMKVKFSSKGGKICAVELKKYKTFDHQNLILFDEKTADFNLSFFANNRSINTKDLFFNVVLDKRFENNDSIIVSGDDSLTIALRLYPDVLDTASNKSQYLEFLYTIKGNKYAIDFNINIVGLQNVIAAGTNFLDLAWNMQLKQQEKSLDVERSNTTIYYKNFDDDVDFISERKNEKKSLKTKVQWVSFKQQFFSSTLIAKNYFENADIETATDPLKKDRYLKSTSALIGVPYNASSNNNIALLFYFGPNKYNTLKKYNLDLERQIPLGWSFFLMAWINRYAVIPVFDFLGTFNWNYGIIILVLTILLKIVLLPIAYKTYLSSAKMRLLKPEIDEINGKFKKGQELEKQKATMSLYKKAGVNPMSGCVPLLLQLPILIALFRFFPASIELRQQPFLWADDLSSYDSIWNLPFNIPFYGDHVSLFTLLMTVSTIIYTRINNQMMASTNQMPGMKLMTYLMPIMFLGIFNNYSSGLSYYYFLANIITFAQMYLFRGFVNEEKLHAKIQENKKKPIQKSGFQKRLEEMAKKRGYSPR